MAAPPKPWEQQQQQGGVSGAGGGLGAATPGRQPSQSAPLASGAPAAPAAPPPVPSRAGAASRFTNGIAGGSAPFYGGGGYGGYGGYSPHHAYPHHPHHSRFGYGGPSPYRDGPEGSVYQQMQENGRSAFETVERLVFAVSSVAAMLESSYDALYSSFMAVVSVADHMDQLKEQLLSILKSLVRLRFLKRMIVKLLRLFHIPVPSFLLETDLSTAAAANNARSRFPWPLIAFFALVFGSPIVVYSMMRSRKRDARRPVRARVAWDYSAQKNDELSLTKGDVVTVSPPKDEPDGWVTAETEDGSRGLVPKNYVRLIPQKNGSAAITAPTQQPQQQQQQQVVGAEGGPEVLYVPQTASQADMESVFQEAQGGAPVALGQQQQQQQQRERGDGDGDGDGDEVGVVAPLTANASADGDQGGVRQQQQRSDRHGVEEGDHDGDDVDELGETP